MATAVSVSACENKRTQKPFSKSEIEAAKQLIQLSSSGDDYSEEEGGGGGGGDHHSSNNSCSYSVVQGNPQEDQSTIKVDTVGDVSSVAATAEEDEDETLPRRNNKRYRFIEDLYSVTVPVPAVKAKKMKTRK